MCGIVGIFGPGYDVRSTLGRMTSAIAHRGPDDEGYYVGDNIGMGVRRLAIIDLNTGHQPILNEDKSIVVVLNGEIYNYQILRRELEARGHRFSTLTDTEIIVHLYEDMGEDCVQRLRGMFAFAVWDSRTQKLLLARDRLGIKPLYYAVRGNTFLFASELKALLASGMVERELNLQGLHHYLSFYAIPAPHTVLKDVKALPPAHTIEVSNSDHRSYQYWDLNFGPSPDVQAMDEQEIGQRLRHLLEESVRIHLQSDVPWGVFLSGGVDSSTVLGLMTGTVTNGSPIRTFSIGFGTEGEKIDELDYARLVAERFHTDHTEVVISGRDVLDNLDHIIWSLDQPSGDGINSYFVSKTARNSVTVALSGLGGDELFAGYPQFRAMAELARYDGFRDQLPGTIRRMIRCMSWLPNSLSAHRPFNVAAQMGMAMNDFLGRYAPLAVKLFDEKTKHDLYSQVLRSRLNNVECLEEYISRYVRAEETDPVDKVSRVKLQHYMAHTLLRDADVMSMAHSLEMRVPLIDHELVEFVATIPSCYKDKNGADKYILKWTMRDIVPAEVIGRRKQGFLIPMEAWLRTELKPVVDEVFSRRSVERRGIFEYAGMQDIYRRFFRGEAPYLWIWSLVVLELWMRRYLDGHA